MMCLAVKNPTCELTYSPLAHTTCRLYIKFRVFAITNYEDA